MSKKKNFTANKIIVQIQLLHSFFWDSRFFAVNMAYDDVKQDTSQPIKIKDCDFQTFYDISIPVIRNFHVKDKDIGYYLRQNFVIRLFALLQYYGAYDDFDNRTHLKGYAELKILKGLRNRFSHTYGVYDRKDKNLTNTIIKHFNLPKSEYNAIPIPIEPVIDSFYEKSIQYIKELFKEL